MAKPPLITTPKQAISVVLSEESKEFDQTAKYFEQVVDRITKGSNESLFVLAVVLRELPKLKVGEKIGFDFGTNKKWELKRLEDFKS